MQYDAFISYRHVPHDSWVAETIHKNLEHFHIPRSIRQSTGKKRFSRVFRDKEELQASSDLPKRIHEALDHAEYLIVICSPEVKESKWVQEEVRYFLQGHGDDFDKIMVVLAAGEPDEAIPDVIRNYNGQEREFMAVDFRGDSAEEIRKKQKDEMFRLISSMLGVSFDKLKKRHAIYRRKQAGLIASIIAAVMAVFIGTTAYQKALTAREAHEKLVNKAEYSARTSLELLRSGDRNGAVEEALSVRDPRDPKKLVSPYQTYALNRALYSYKTGEWVDYEPTGTIGSEINDGFFSENAACYYTFDGNNCISCYSTEDYSLRWSVDESLVDAAIEPEIYRYSDTVSTRIEKMLPYGDHRLVLIGGHVVSILDSASGEIERVFPTRVAGSTINASLNGDKLTLCSEISNIYIYDLKTGEQVCKCSPARYLTGFDRDKYAKCYMEITYSCVASDPEGSEIVLGVRNGSMKGYLEKFDFYPEEEVEITPGLYVYTAADDSVRLISDKVTVQAEYFGDNRLVTQQYVNYGEEDSVYGVGLRSYSTAVYDTDSWELLFSGETSTVLTTSTNILCKEFQSEGGSFKGIVVSLGDHVSVINLETGELVTQLSFDSNITNLIEWGSGHIIAATDTGWVQRICVENDYSRKDVLELKSSVKFTSGSFAIGTLACCIDGRISFFKIEEDENLTCTVAGKSEEDRFDTLDYFHGATDNYYLVRKWNFNEPDIILICNMEDHREVYRTQLEDGMDVGSYGFYEKDGSSFFWFFEGDSDILQNTRADLHTVNLATKEDTVLDCRIDDISARALSFSPQRQMVVFTTQPPESMNDMLVLLPVNGQELSDPVYVALDDSCYDFRLTGDGNYVFLYSSLYNKPLIYDIENEDFISCDDRLLDIKLSSATSLEIAPDDSLVNIYDDSSVYILDCATGKIVSEIAFERGSERPDFAFFSKDSEHRNSHLLIVYKHSVLMYDVQTGEFVSSVAFTPKDSFMRSSSLSVRADESGRYFAVEQTGTSSSMTHGPSLRGEFIFFVDDSLHMAPYAEVVGGHSDFANEQIMILADNRIYSSAFYKDEELVEKAETLLGLDQDPVEITEDNLTADVSEETEESSAAAAQEKSPLTWNTDAATVAEDESTDFDEMSIWNLAEHITRIEAEDKGSSYVIQLPDEPTKKVRRITENILGCYDNDNETFYYDVLTGRELQANQLNQVEFLKNQQILGYGTGDTDGLKPLLKVLEKEEGGHRSWISGRHSITKDAYSEYDMRIVNFLVNDEEGTDIKPYKILLDQDQEGEKSPAEPYQEEAFLQDSHEIRISSSVAEYSEYLTGSGVADSGIADSAITDSGIRDSGATKPVEKMPDGSYFTNGYVQSKSQYVTSLDDFFIECAGLDQFREAFVCQICIYYEDGTIQTTDFLPLQKERADESLTITEDGIEYLVGSDSLSVLSVEEEPDSAEMSVEEDPDAVEMSVEEEPISVEIPSEVAGKPVKRILSDAFTWKGNLKSIKIPSGIETIDYGAMPADSSVTIEVADDQKYFMIKDRLLMSSDGKRVICAADTLEEELVIPEGVEEIDSYAFSENRELKRVVFPDSLRSIGNSAFAGVFLEDLNLPDGVEYIGDNAFGRERLYFSDRNEKVSDVKIIKIGKKAKYIGKGAFGGICTRAFEVDPDNPCYCTEDGVIYSKDRKILYKYPSGKSGAFSVPEGVERIAEAAFLDSGFYHSKMDEAWGIIELTLADSLKTIDYHNIPENGKLQKIIPGKGLESWQDYNLVKYLEITEDGPVIQDEYGCLYNREKTRLIFCPDTLEEFTIPETVCEIEYQAFSGTTNLKRLRIPAAVDLAPKNAQSFVNCFNNYNDIQIEEFDVEPGNPDFSSKDGNLMSASGNTLLVEAFTE